APAVYTTTGTPYWITNGDFNGDGKPDLVTASFESNSLNILMNNGDGTFGVATNLTVGATSPVSVAVGDFDRDGKLDLVTANSVSSDVSLLRGNGNGTFQPATTRSVDTNPQVVVVADFNADGNLDVAATSYDTGRDSLLP